MLWIELISYAAGVFTLINMFPQVIKTYKTKSAEDISYLMVVTYILSMMLWVVYAYFIESWPILTTNSVAFVMGTIQFILMIKYKDNTTSS